MKVLSLDPAAEGALAILDGDEREDLRVVFVALWLRTGDRWSATWTDVRMKLGRAKAASIPGIIARIVRFGLLPAETGTIDAIIYEGAFVGVNPRSALSVSQSTGRILATLERELWLDRSPPEREIANGEWWKLIGMPKTPPGERKEVSLREIPPRFAGLPEMLRTVGEQSHVTDAVGVGVAGMRHAAWRGTASEWSSRLATACGTKPKSARRR